MPKRGLILLAGTLAGILPCGAATSQTTPSSVLNNQVQLGDVFSTQTLNVETVTDQTVGESHATGNQYQASVDGQDIDVRLNQTANGNVTGDTRLNVAADSGAVTQITTTAVGNAGEAGVTGGTLTGVMTQTTGPAAIAGISHIEAPDGRAGDVDSLTQSQGDSQVLSVSAGTAGVRVNQSNAAQVTSNGGGVYGYVSGAAQFQAQTMANDVTYSGDNGSGARIAVSQQNNAALTQAAQFTAFGQVQDGKTIASAAGNNLDAVNEGFLLDAAVDQRNHAYVRAQSETGAASFGALTASANGVGNSAVVGDIGGELVLDNTQVNDGGGIEVLATTSGGDGYDAYANATAAGNAVTG
ncbi:MAG TPA: holdfast anchor protein HfaD, partial [Phenylobacterium sp.]|nr:holdfast anchor protein HfaD [Phenylobacterium sp.]